MIAPSQRPGRLHWHVLLLGALSVAQVACHDSPTASPPPEPGVLTVRLSMPTENDHALRLAISGGAVSEVKVDDGSLTVLARPSNTGAAILLFGKLSSGTVVRLQVPDVKKLSSYRASIVEAADAAHQLRDVTAGYSATIQE